MAMLVRWIGWILYAAGGALRLWPVFVLGRRFSGLVAIQPGHTLVTDGIYRTIRNPSYVGLLVLSLGWALAFRSLPGVLLVALMVPPVIARIRSEEALLSAQFGEEYTQPIAPARGDCSHRLLGSAACDVGAARGELLRHAIIAAIQVVEAVEGCFSCGPKSGKDESGGRAYVGAGDSGAAQPLDTLIRAVRPRTAMSAPIFRNSSTWRKRCSKMVSVIALVPAAAASSAIVGACRSVAKPG